MKNCKYFISLLLSFILICILSKYSKNNIVRKNEIKLSENTQIINDVKFKEEFTNDIDLDILGQDIDKHMQSCENEYNNIFTAIKNKFDTNEKLILSTKNNIENIIDNLEVKKLNNEKNNICEDSLKPIQEKRDRIQKLKNYKIYIEEINTIIVDYKIKFDDSYYTGIIGDSTTSDSILGDKQKYDDIKQKSIGILEKLIRKLENLNQRYHTSSDVNGNDIIESSNELKKNLNTKLEDITTANGATIGLIEAKHNFKTVQYIEGNDINGAINNLCFGSSNNTEQCIQSEWGCNLDCDTKDIDDNCLGSSDNYSDIFGNTIKLHSHMHDYDHHDSSQHIN